MSPVPRTIYSLWLQGEANAPDLVQMCLRRWRRLNPTHVVVVLAEKDLPTVLRRSRIDWHRLPPQALSDLVRVSLLADKGGIWVDSTVLPVVPLDEWLSPAVRSGFFAFTGHRHPLAIDSWLLAAAPDHYLMTTWQRRIEQYWNHPRELMRFRENWEANYLLDPVRAVGAMPVAAESESATRDWVNDRYPYYWLMFLFNALLEEDHRFAAEWSNVDQSSGAVAHAVQWATSRIETMSDDSLVTLARSAVVQKLAFKGPHTRRWTTLDALLAAGESDARLRDYPVFSPNGADTRVASLNRDIRSKLRGRVLRFADRL